MCYNESVRNVLGVLGRGMPLGGDPVRSLVMNWQENLAKIEIVLREIRSGLSSASCNSKLGFRRGLNGRLAVRF